MKLVCARPLKRWGQHFLHDPFVIGKIVEAIAPRAGQHLVEIGPGLGAMTCPLLEAAGELRVVEIDPRVIPELKTRCADRGKLHIYNTDVLRFDFSAIASGRPTLRVVGNLPYNISTPLLFHLLQFASSICDMHFLLQREVVERLTAVPGTQQYGRLTVMVQYRCRTERLFTVRRGAFTPVPKVESALVRLIPHAAAPIRVPDEALFSTLVQQAFSQRRKTLRNSLRRLLTAEQIAAVGVDPRQRAEQLSLQQFAALATQATSSNGPPERTEPPREGRR